VAQYFGLTAVITAALKPEAAIAQMSRGAAAAALIIGIDLLAG
jgi:hypothetical protein